MIKTARDADLRSLQILINLYEKAAPIIRRVANLESLNYGELPVTPYTLVESNLTLRMVLNALKKMPEPKDKILFSIRKELENAIISCIKAADAAEKYSELGGDRTNRGHIFLNSIINATVMAHEYIESVAQKLETSSAEITQAKGDEVRVMPAVKEKSRWKPSYSVTLSPGTNPIQTGIDKIAHGIESGLDKLGDIMTLPILGIAKVINIVSGAAKGTGRKKR